MVKILFRVVSCLPAAVCEGWVFRGQPFSLGRNQFHRRQRRKRRFLWAVDLNLRSLRYLLFKIFRRRFCYGENTVSRRFAPARRSMRRLGVSWAASLPGWNQFTEGNPAMPIQPSQLLRRSRLGGVDGSGAAGEGKPRFLCGDLNLRSP